MEVLALIKIPAKKGDPGQKGRSRPKRAITRIAPTAQPGDFGRGEPCVRPKMAETMIKADILKQFQSRRDDA